MDKILTREEVVAFLEEHLTEENTDAALDAMVEAVATKLPKLGKFKIVLSIIRWLLDKVLPEGLIKAVDAALIKAGL